jgi:hypothetical protein
VGWFGALVGLAGLPASASGSRSTGPDSEIFDSNMCCVITRSLPRMRRMRVSATSAQVS